MLCICWVFCFLTMQIVSTCRALWRAEIRTKPSASISFERDLEQSGPSRITAAPLSASATASWPSPTPHPQARLPWSHQEVVTQGGGRPPETSVSYTETLLSARASGRLPCGVLSVTSLKFSDLECPGGILGLQGPGGCNVLILLRTIPGYL